jgi:hypothetical protein
VSPVPAIATSGAAGAYLHTSPFPGRSLHAARFAALAALALLGTAAQADDWNRTYPVRGRATVSIRTNDGHVHVTEGAGKEVQVRIHTVGWHIGGQVQVDGRQSGDRIDVEARVPNWHMGLTITFNETRRLEIEVVTPRQSDLVIRTGDGGVEIERITGRVEVETGTGTSAAPS